MIKISDKNFKVNDFDSFNITNIKINFFYLDSLQKAEIASTDTILIMGGKVRI